MQPPQSVEEVKATLETTEIYTRGYTLSLHDALPISPEEAVHPRFVEALQKQAHVEYLLDVLLFGDTEEIAH